MSLMHKESRIALAQRAIDQYGRLTSIDLDQLGIGGDALEDLEQRGILAQVARGLYRYQDPLMDAVLWPRGLRGILCHHTALWVHGLYHDESQKVHITVPKHYTSRRAVPPTYEIYQRDLEESAITTLRGLPVVTPCRAVLDVIELDGRSEVVMKAMSTAQQAGLFGADELTAIESMLGD